MATPRTPRRAWIEQGLVALSAGGPDAVRIEVLAKALGVTKGGFYGYFADREALLTEMLDLWESEATEAIIADVEEPGGDPRAKLNRLRRTIAAGAGRTTDVTTDQAIRGWARRDSAVAERLRRVDNRRMDYLRTLYRGICADEDDVEARSLLSYSLWIGRHLVAADNGTRDPAAVDRVIAALLQG
jgi:AcrR family transcriptional regulator